MLSSALPLAVLLGLSNALAIDVRQNDAYYYLPVDYDYGFDSRVTANFTFGTASDAELVQVVMDSGSANFWIWGPAAVVHWGSQYLGDPGPCNVTVPTIYDPSLSPTATVYNHTSVYSYAGNSKIVTGVQYANDTLTAAGGSAPFTNVQFALEDYAILKILDDGSCTGVEYDEAILGLSPFTNDTVGPSFRQNLFDSGKVASKTLVMWLDKHVGALGKLTGGVLFGAIDTSKYTGPLVQVPNVVTPAQIGVYAPRPNITIGGQTFVPDETDTECLIDSGSHGDTLPFAYDGTLQDTFINAAGLVNYNGVAAFNGSCEDIPADFAITYTFPDVTGTETVNIDVLLRNYARGWASPVDEPELCLLNLELGGCLFGAPFLSGAFVALDDEDNSLWLAQGGISEEGSGVDSASLKTIGKGQGFGTV